LREFLFFIGRRGLASVFFLELDRFGKMRPNKNGKEEKEARIRIATRLIAGNSTFLKSKMQLFPAIT